MELYYPVKDQINPSNPFGANPDWYAKLGQKGHPGNDFEAPSGTKLFSPCDGLAFYVRDSIGGDGLWIYNTSDGENHVVILWHLYARGDADHPFQIPSDGTKTLVKAGEFLGYTDNSGFHPAPQESESTGPHLHLGVIPCDLNWNRNEPENGFNGCVDPKPFYSGKFAEDINTSQQIVEKSAQVVELVNKGDLSHQEKLDIWEKVAEFLRELISKV